jgi:hypothetical protein
VPQRSALPPCRHGSASSRARPPFSTAHRPPARPAGEEAQQAAPPPVDAPRGFFAGLFGGLGGARQAAAPEKLVRPVVFPPEDLKTLVALNNALLRSGAVKANAD